MTRTTVYLGQPWEDEHETLADVSHDHEEKRAVTIKTTGGQEFHIREDEAVDIYINGEKVDE